MKQLAQKLKKVLHDQGLIDLILFGSVAKGKITANDLDIAAITEKNIEKQELVKEIKKVGRTTKTKIKTTIKTRTQLKI